eukprot:5181282-Pleurochrysis_carterae.AAC.1
MKARHSPCAEWSCCCAAGRDARCDDTRRCDALFRSASCRCRRCKPGCECGADVCACRQRARETQARHTG